MAAPSTAWSYAAVSSSPQEATLEDQQQWACDTAARNGWIITREFSGVASGAKGPREILRVLIDELERAPKAARPQRVLMIRLDRVGRMALDCIAALARLRKLGVVLHTRQDGDVKLETAMDTFRPIFELFTAEMENAARSDKWKAVHARRRAEGKHDPRGRSHMQPRLIRTSYQLPEMHLPVTSCKLAVRLRRLHSRVGGWSRTT